MIEQVTDGVMRIGSRSHNYYLLTDEGRVTIVDAGCSREWGTLLRALDAAGVALVSVEGVIITHAHADHFGLAKKLTEADIEVSVHADEETRATGRYQGRFAVSPNELPVFKPAVVFNLLPMVTSGVMKLEFPDSVHTFDDGDQLDLPGRPVVVHTPGHTEGHVMFHFPDRGLLFTGDGLATMDLVGFGTGPQMLDSRFHLDAEQADRSLERIVDVEAETLLPGHGKPWSGSPAAAVQAVRSRS
jgi:glyoxylase-like metal-dependent hydrolase (beta-lactamase superfamily II)